MKTNVIILLFIFISQLCIANDYTVLHVKGKIKVKSTGNYLKPSDKLHENEQVIFESAQAMAVLIHPKKGRQLLKSQSTSLTESSEIASFVHRTLVAGTGRMSTRPGKLTNDLAFKNQFEVDEKDFFNGNYVFIDEMNRFQVSTQNYPLDANNFFFIRYEVNGEEINKMLLFEGDQFIISKKELFKVDNQRIDIQQVANIEMYYRHSATSESRILCKLNPVFLSKQTLKGEIATLLPFMRGMNKDEKIGELLGYLADAHGKVDADQLNIFMSRNFPEEWK